MRRSASLLALLATIAPAQVQPSPKAPTGKWLIDFADKTCSLERNYGDASAQTTLAFIPTPFSDRLGLYVIAPKSGTEDYSGDGTIGFGPAQPPADTFIESYDARSVGRRITRSGLSRADLSRAYAGGRIAFIVRKQAGMSFLVPGLEKALGVLDECVVDLVDSWGFSRAEQARLATPAEALGKISADDYPRNAMEAADQGKNSARISVDADGRAHDCVVVESSGSEDLDGALCKVMRRSRYKPAIDKSGRPMNGLAFQRVTWRME